jgi:hypothetical protein
MSRIARTPAGGGGGSGRVFAFLHLGLGLGSARLTLTLAPGLLAQRSNGAGQRDREHQPRIRPGDTIAPHEKLPDDTSGSAWAIPAARSDDTRARPAE